VFELGQVLGGPGNRLGEPSHAVLESADTFQNMLFQILLCLDEKLLGGFALILGNPRHDHQLATAPPATLPLVGIDRTAELTEHGLNPRCS
jgi:hypothetical protein